MKQKSTLLLFAILITGLFSCKTASRLYEKGRYDEAVAVAARKLQKDPDDPKLLSVLQDAYRFAVNDHEDEIRSLAASNNELRWERMHETYQSLQRLYEAIFRVPAVFDRVHPTDYSSYVATYAAKAADVRFDRGIALLQRGDRSSYRSAYQEFQAAQRLKPGDAAIRQKLDEAWEGAVVNVIVEPLQQRGGFLYSSYRLGGSNLDDELIRRLRNNPGNEFVRVYDAWDARANRVRPDLILNLQLVTMDIGRFRDFNSTRRVSKEVVVKETVYRPDSIVREYAKVFAEITTTRRSLRSGAVFQASLFDPSGGPLWNEQFLAEQNWDTEFATFTGDARALSDADKKLVDRRREIPPQDNDIVQCLLETITENALHRIRSKLGNY